jgi:hypothetical protein
MSKSVKKRTAASTSATTAAKAAQLSQNEPKPEQGKSGSKQSHVIAMLRSPAGATIDALNSVQSEYRRKRFEYSLL